MKKHRYLGIRVPPDLWLAVQSAIASSGQTQADWLRSALSQAIERHSLLAEIHSLIIASERRLVSDFRADLDAALQSIEIV